jgi:hypothetical protein
MTGRPTTRPLDKRALRILSSTYWSPSGWKKTYTTPPDDLAYAKAAGIMFDPECLTHDDMVERALRSLGRVSKEQVTRAFLASLTSRRLDWRSALGSFAVSLHFPPHCWSRVQNSQFNCPICGVYESKNPQDMNVLNFERFKWGGVRHGDPLYIGFDLELLAREKPPEPTNKDRSVMRNILDRVRSLPVHSKLSDLAKALASILPSNLNERRSLIGILGYCGILQDPAKPGFLEGFPPYAERPQVPWAKNDWPYPVQWWNGSCGVSEEAVAFWLPGL